MISKKLITGLAVETLTAAGKEGTCWLKENDNTRVGQVDVRIYHTTLGEPTIETVRDLGKRVFVPYANIDMMDISVDDLTDVYYAVCFNDNDQATIVTDVA